MGKGNFPGIPGKFRKVKINRETAVIAALKAKPPSGWLGGRGDSAGLANGIQNAPSAAQVPANFGLGIHTHICIVMDC
jgi:hypothetical protein